MAEDIWPFDLLAPTTLQWSPQTTVNKGGATISGLEQRDRVDGGPLWQANLRVIPVWTGRQILAHSALEMILVGDLSPIVVQRRPPRCDILTGGDPQLVPHSDGTPFSDDALYFSGGSIIAVTTASATLGATHISFSLAGANRSLLGGEEFTIVHPIAGTRMYRVKRITSNVGELYTVQIGPPLRDDVGAGTVLDFDDPRCLMRLEDLEAFALELEMNEHGQFDAIFQEAYW